MMLCTQCKGYGKTFPINQSCNVPNGVTFTAPTQVPLNLCNYCGGNGYFTGSGS
jgi:hypothetical protein